MKPIGLNEYGAMRFCRLPKNLYLNKKRYGGLSFKAMVLYAILFDRLALSVAHRWVDETGLFIYAKRKELANLMGLSESKLKEGFAELKRFGLLESKRQAMGLPSKVYLFMPETADEEGVEDERGEAPFTDNEGAEWQCARNGADSAPGNGPTQVPLTGRQWARNGGENNETELKDTNKSETEFDCGDACASTPAPAPASPGKKKNSRSLIPTLDEVKAYAKEKDVDERIAEDFFNYWESVGWKRKGSPLVKWKAAFATWLRNEDRWQKENPRRRAATAKDEKEDEEEARRHREFEEWHKHLIEEQDRMLDEFDRQEREREERRRQSEAAEEMKDAINEWRNELKVMARDGREALTDGNQRNGNLEKALTMARR